MKIRNLNGLNFPTARDNVHRTKGALPLPKKKYLEHTGTPWSFPHQRTRNNSTKQCNSQVWLADGKHGDWKSKRRAKQALVGPALGINMGDRKRSSWISEQTKVKGIIECDKRTKMGWGLCQRRRHAYFMFLIFALFCLKRLSQSVRNYTHAYSYINICIYTYLSIKQIWVWELMNR